VKKDIKHMRASIRAKLQNKAKETNRPFAEVLQYFGIEKETKNRPPFFSIGLLKRVFHALMLNNIFPN